MQDKNKKTLDSRGCQEKIEDAMARKNGGFPREARCFMPFFFLFSRNEMFRFSIVVSCTFEFKYMKFNFEPFHVMGVTVVGSDRFFLSYFSFNCI